MDQHKTDVITKMIPIIQEAKLEYSYWKDCGERDRVRFQNAQEKILELIRLVSTVDLGEEVQGNIARAFYYLQPCQRVDVYLILDKVEDFIRDSIVSELTGKQIDPEEK